MTTRLMLVFLGYVLGCAVLLYAFYYVNPTVPLLYQDETTRYCRVMSVLDACAAEGDPTVRACASPWGITVDQGNFR